MQWTISGTLGEVQQRHRKLVMHCECVNSDSHFLWLKFTHNLHLENIWMEKLLTAHSRLRKKKCAHTAG